MDMIANSSAPLWAFNATMGYNFTDIGLNPNLTSSNQSDPITNFTQLDFLITQSAIQDNDSPSTFLPKLEKPPDIKGNISSSKAIKNVVPGFPITYLSDDAAKSTPPRLHGIVKQVDHIPDSVEEPHGTSHRLSRGHMAAVVVSSVCVFVLVVILWVYCKKPYNYQKIQMDDSSKYEYIYKPLAGGGLDEEYENTFVGVSIPLLQDNTKV